MLITLRGKEKELLGFLVLFCFDSSAQLVGRERM